MRQLQEWLGEKCKWNLCYRPSRDGWSGHDFHEHCDDKGPTVTLVKANNCIFGGYTDLNWEGMSNQCQSFYCMNCIFGDFPKYYPEMTSQGLGSRLG
jgi:hypothetical protein